MDNAKEERYVFLRSCSSDLSEAIRLLDAAASQPPQIAYALLRYAVIVYFRSFTRADTRFFHPQHKGPERQSIRLSPSFVPPDLLPLHQELETYRNSAYAHSDLAKRNPRLHYWRSGPWQFPIALSPVDKKPLHIHQDDIRRLCEVGLEWVTSELGAMEEGFKAEYSEG